MIKWETWKRNVTFLSLMTLFTVKHRIHSVILHVFIMSSMIWYDYDYNDMWKVIWGEILTLEIWISTYTLCGTNVEGCWLNIFSLNGRNTLICLKEYYANIDLHHINIGFPFLWRGKTRGGGNKPPTLPSGPKAS